MNYQVIADSDGELYLFSSLNRAIDYADAMTDAGFSVTLEILFTE